MKREHRFNKIFWTFVVLGSSLVLTGCGGYHRIAPQSTASGFIVTPPSTTTSGTSITVGTSSGTAQVSGSGNLGVAPATYRVGATGYVSTSITVYTRTVLKVRFTPGVQDQNIAGSGFSPQYSKLGVYIGVNGNTSPTEMLSNGAQGAAVQKSHIFDLSQQFVSHCSATDTTCSTSVAVTIAQPNYDYWCMNFQQYCPWDYVYPTHPWHGTLEVQTDMTDPIQ